MLTPTHTAHQLSVVLFGNTCSPISWRALHLDRQGAINVTKYLIASNYDIPVLENLQYLVRFFPDAELEKLILNDRFLYKLQNSFMKRDMLTTPTMIKLSGFANKELQNELATIAKRCRDLGFYYIVTKDSGSMIDAPIASYEPTDPRLLTLFKNKFKSQDDGTHVAKFLSLFFDYIESDKLFAEAVDFLQQGTPWCKAAVLHYKKCHEDKGLFVKSMTSWLRSDLAYVTRPHGVLPTDFIKTLSSELLIQMYANSVLIGYLPGYPDLGKKCLGTIMHNPAARPQVSQAVKMATYRKATPLEEYRKLAGKVPEAYLIDMFLINNLQTPPHTGGAFIDFTKTVEYQQLPEDVRPYPDLLTHTIREMI